MTPASLKGEWEEQIARRSLFWLTDAYCSWITGGSLESLYARFFFYLVNYEQVRSDFADMQEIIVPDIMILDEAQRIKNWPPRTNDSG